MKTKIKPTIAMPPAQTINHKVNLEDPAILAMIEGGGGTVSEKRNISSDINVINDELKNFSIRIFQSELDDIKKHLKGLGGRKTKSIHTFILEAINEKLKRETKKTRA